MLFQIQPQFIEKLKTSSDKLLEVLEQHLPSGKRDGSVYTGTAGVALLYLTLGERNNNPAYLEVCILSFFEQLHNNDKNILAMFIENLGCYNN